MGDDVISKRNRKSVEAAVEHFVGNRHLFENFAQALMAYFRNDAGLARCTQFLKYRVKDPGHLREKLIRKAAQGDVIDETTLFDRITDLAGIRIIHLHTDQCTTFIWQSRASLQSNNFALWKGARIR